MLPSFLTLAFALLLAQAPGQRAPSDSPLAITSVSVIDVSTAGSALRTNQTVIIRDGRIAAVGTSRTTAVPVGARRIDGSGKFLIPGLWDAHAHALGPDRRDSFLPLYVVNGVTSIRDMHTVIPMKEVHQLRADIEAGKRIGPHLAAVAGPMIAGPGSRFTDDTVSTEEEARRAVIARKEMGVDFIKVHEGLSPSLRLAIADETKRQGLTLVGHKGPLSVHDAAEAGHHSFEHAGFLLFETSSMADSRSQRPSVPQNEGPMMLRTLRNGGIARQSYSEERFKTICDEFRSKGAWLTPTLVQGYIWNYLKDRSIPSSGWLKYMPLRFTSTWQAPHPAMGEPTERDFFEAQASFDKTIELVGRMHRAGINIMAGTDANGGLAGLVPGISLHSELALLVKAGFTPLEALRAATLAPARFLKRESITGSIAVGKTADLVLLEANPLENIRHTEKINAVIVGGRLHDRSTIDGMLAGLAAAARN